MQAAVPGRKHRRECGSGPWGESYCNTAVQRRDPRFPEAVASAAFLRGLSGGAADGRRSEELSEGIPECEHSAGGGIVRRGDQRRGEI